MTFFSPTRVLIGFDADQIFGYVKAKKYLILSSNSAAELSGALPQVKKALKSIGSSFIFENSIKPNPTVKSINTIYEKYRREGIEAIISIGGGSVIDAGKVINLCLANAVDCSSLISADYSNFLKLPHIAIPTTCGTGSETSKGAILSDYESEWKGGVRGHNVFCDLAVLEPNFISSLPLRLCLATGFDAISHAIETYISKASSSITKSLSIASLKMLIPVLINLAFNKDMKSLSFLAKQDLLVGSCIAGINLANSTTCLPHRLQYCIGSISDTTHVDGVALLYPAWVKNLREKELQVFFEINNQLRSIDPLLDVNEPIIELLNILGMRKTAADLGLSFSMINKLTSLASGTLELDPGYEDSKTIVKIFEDTFQCKQ